MLFRQTARVESTTSPDLALYGLVALPYRSKVSSGARARLRSILSVWEGFESRTLVLFSRSCSSTSSVTVPFGTSWKQLLAPVRPPSEPDFVHPSGGFWPEGGHKIEVPDSASSWWRPGEGAEPGGHRLLGWRLAVRRGKRSRERSDDGGQVVFEPLANHLGSDLRRHCLLNGSF